jgi:hypothetical protein
VMGGGRKVNGGRGFLRQNWLEVISRDHPHDVSIRDVQPGDAGLVDGRNVGRPVPAPLRHDRISPDRAGANLGNCIRGLIEHDVDLSGDQILHRRSATPIRHEGELGPRGLLKIDAGDLQGNRVKKSCGD